MEPLKLFIIRPTMGQGGAEFVTLTLLRKLDRRLFAPSLVVMKKEGVWLEQVPGDVTIYSLGAANLWFSWIPLAKLFAELQPDIVFALGGTDIPSVIAFRLTRQRGRLVLSERNILFHGRLTPKRRLIVWLKRLLFPMAHQLTAISECLKQDMVEKLRLEPNLIDVIYNPIVEDSIEQLCLEPVKHPWFSEDVPILLGAGRLVPQKDFATLIRAFSEVCSSRPARLVVLGEGPLRAQLEELTRNLGISNKVWFAGFDTNPLKYMKRCTVFVLSSVHEGLGNVLIQAMACGTAVIATDCPCGPSEIVARPGTDGLLVPVGDQKALAQKINYLLDNPRLRVEMGKRAKESAQRFHVDTITKRYVAALTGMR